MYLMIPTENLLAPCSPIPLCYPTLPFSSSPQPHCNSLDLRPFTTSFKHLINTIIQYERSHQFEWYSYYNSQYFPSPPPPLQCHRLTSFNTTTVGQAGVQIANSCWEVGTWYSIHTTPLLTLMPPSSTVLSTVFRYAIVLQPLLSEGSTLTPAIYLQPDGYLTEERQSGPQDQGFSTFFSETGE